MTLNIYGSDSQVEEVSSSRFGNPDGEADLSCVITGMRVSFPDAHIVPTATFWEKAVAPDEVVELSELFVAPASIRWQALDLDVLVIAYHKIVDVQTDFVEGFVEGAYLDKDRETAAVVVIDLQNQKIIHASKITFEDVDFIAHFFFVIPFGLATIATSDPCNMVGEAAGAAITNTVPKPAPRVVVVAAGNNPYDSAQTVIREEEREREEARLERECFLPFSEALLLDVDTQGQRATSCGEFGDPVGWQWLCLAAHNEDPEAQDKIGSFYENGGGPVSQDLILAYIWYSLAEVNGFKEGGSNTRKTATGWACCFPDIPRREIIAEDLTPAQIREAERLVAEWEPNPAGCELETAVTTD